MSGQHAVLSPSSAERWIMCPGSVKMSEGLPNETSVYAEEGTKAHEIAAWTLQDASRKAEDFPGSREDTELGYALDAYDMRAIQGYVDEVRRRAEGKMLFIENHVDIERHTSETGGKGTSDAIVVDIAAGFIEVIDLKFGKGVMVDADNNYQEMLYALGSIDFVEDLIGGPIKTIRCTIIQPRLDHISQYDTDRERMNQFSAFAHSRGRLALSATKGEHLEPGPDACRWCPARRAQKCEAFDKKMRLEMLEEFETVGESVTKAKPVGGIMDVPTPEILEMARMWISGWEEEIEKRLKNREDVPGWKLVLGKKGDRAWIDEDSVLKVLKRMGFKKDRTHTEPKLKSPAQIEKLVTKEGWNEFTPLINQPPGRPVVVSEKDKKEAYVPATTNEFDDVSDNVEDLF